MTDLSSHWAQVKQQAERLKPIHLRELFAQDPTRFAKYSARLDDLLIDFSKEKIDQTALNTLLDLAKAAKVEQWRDQMLSGAKINSTENRAVLHTALRGGANADLVIDGQNVNADVEAVKARFLAFAEQVRTGQYAAPNGKPFTDVVNIGIGGSDLGPVMVTLALAPYHDGPRTHFVSNVDGAHIADTLKTLNPETTLFIIASKTFTTAETMQNFATALTWLEQRVGKENSGKHLVAVSTNLERTRQFGIDDSRVFGFWDWVGGRYSLWSSIGLSIAIAVGAKQFQNLLDGAKSMDEHFRSAPLAQNLPVLLALIGIWRRNGLNYPTVGLMPYDQRLARFPAYVQQLDMESNGKYISREGTPVTQATGPIVWGEPGTNSQHSFFQLIHQGTGIIPVDFLLAANDHHAKPIQGVFEHHTVLMTNALAQANALAFGRTSDEVRAEMQTSGAKPEAIEALVPHRTFLGDRPSTMLLYKQLDAFTLGRLIALFEHKVFVQGIIWNINSYDQWGVELGKKLANTLQPIVAGAAIPDSLDSSTRGLIEHIHQLRQPEIQQ